MQISWWTLVIQCVNFLVLVWLLNRFLYKPVHRVIEQRRAKELAAEEGAKNAQREAEAAKQRYDKALGDIEAERQAALQKAHAEIEAERAHAMDEAKNESAKRLAEAKADIDKYSAEALRTSKARTTDLAVDMARRLLSEYAPSIPGDIVLEQLERHLRDMKPEAKARLEADISSNHSGLTVVTARELAEVDQRKWQDRLAKALQHPLRINFKVDAGLIAGAVLELPHTTLRTAWSDQLAEAREALLNGDAGRLH